MLFGETNPGRRLSAPAGSSYSVLEDGLYGIYTVLEEQQLARRWTLPLDRLDEQIDRIVIWDVGDLTAAQMEALLNWVSLGHVALIGGEVGKLEAAVFAMEGEVARSAAAHPATLGVEWVSVGEGRFSHETGAQLVHLRDERGQPVLVSWEAGAGRIYHSADVEWLTNKRIANGQNLDLALQILLPAEGRMVAFDEYHHGYQTATRWWQILRGPLRLFVGLLAVAVAILFWAYGARFGSPRPALPGPPRAAVEYVYSMSQLYRRAQARKVVVQALYRSLTLELGRMLGGVRGLTHAQIAERTAHRAKAKPEEIIRLLNRLDPKASALPSEAELIRLARETEDLQRRMHHGGYRDQRNPGTGTE
ncbi:MAG: DUF4350 domain-containing protein [Bacillota bacterium]